MLADFPNISELEVAIDTVKRAGQIEQSLHTLIHEGEQKEWQIKDEMSHLPQWEGTYQELVELPVPVLSETVKQYEMKRKDLLQMLQKTQEQLINQKEAIERHEARIRELESLAEIPSNEKLLTVRASRDKGWNLIRTKLQQESCDPEQLNAYTNGQHIEAVFEGHVRDADHIADTMRTEAEKVGEKNKLLSDIESCKRKIEELEKEEQRLTEEVKAWETAWIELWKPSKISPLSPEEMKEWLIKYGQLKGMVQDLVKVQSSIRDLENKKTQCKSVLISALKQFVNVSMDQTVDELLSIAEQKQKVIRDAINKRSNVEASILEIEEKVKNIVHEKTKMETDISNWRKEWEEAIQGTNISISTSSSVAERLLSKYESCAQAYEEFIRVEKEQEAIQIQIDRFKEKVKNAVRTVMIAVDEPNVDIAVNQLQAALQKAQQDQVTRTNLTSQYEGLCIRMQEATDEINGANTTLRDLMKEAKCSTIEELKQVEKTYVRKKEYEANIQLIKNEMLELGNGRSFKELMAEADQYEADRIEGELEEIRRKLDNMEVERSQLEQGYGVIKKEFEEKIQGNNTASVLAEQEKESILAQLASLTEQYIQIKLAHVLLQKGIEHYRNQNQDPILKRASELFARLTLQSFVGLMADYDEKDQPVLIGVRENGDKVPIEGMSDGTTDQLYLSLRIASIEKYVQENEPIPFIVDDILVHFDDIRSKETLKILLELSRYTQIIFFTHHARLTRSYEGKCIRKGLSGNGN